MRYLLLLFVLTACEPGSALYRVNRAVVSNTTGNPPMVTAADGSTAYLTIVACPTQNSGAQIVSDLVNSLSSSSPLVTSSEGASARLTINTCPSNYPTTYRR